MSGHQSQPAPEFRTEPEPYYIEEPDRRVRWLSQLARGIWWAIIATALIGYGVMTYLLVDLARGISPVLTFVVVVGMIGGMVWVIQGERR